MQGKPQISAQGISLLEAEAFSPACSDDQPRVVPQDPVLLAKFPEHRQAFFFLRSILIAKTIPQIELAKVRVEFALAGDERIELAQVVVPSGAQTVRDRLGRSYLGPDQPKRIDKRKLRLFLPFFAEVPELKCLLAFVPEPDRLVADEKLREARRESALDEPRADHKLRRQPDLRQETAEQIYSGLRSGIDLDLLDLGEVAAVPDKNAVHRAARRDRNAVDERVNRVAQKFETGNERDVELGGGQFLAEHARMSEHDFARPSVNERAGVEILNATDP